MQQRRRQGASETREARSPPQPAAGGAWIPLSPSWRGAFSEGAQSESKTIRTHKLPTKAKERENDTVRTGRTGHAYAGAQPAGGEHTAQMRSNRNRRGAMPPSGNPTPPQRQPAWPEATNMR